MKLNWVTDQFTGVADDRATINSMQKRDFGSVNQSSLEPLSHNSGLDVVFTNKSIQSQINVYLFYTEGLQGQMPRCSTTLVVLNTKSYTYHLFTC